MSSSSYIFFRPRHGQEDLSYLFDEGPVAGIVVDTRGAIIRANREMEILLGLSCDEIVGRDLIDFVHDEDAALVEEFRARTLQGQMVDDMECRMFSARGGERWVSWRSRKTAGTEQVMFGRDVTHERHPPSIETTVSRFGAAIERVESQLTDAPQDARWGKWIAFLLAIVGAIFAAGVSFQMWSEHNATDEELRQSIEHVMEAHVSADTPHEGLSKASKDHAQSIERLESGQSRLELLAQYQFHHARWQEAVDEARRRGRKPPEKPKRLRDLENHLMGFEAE